MAGNQFGFKYIFEQYILDLLDIIIDRLNQSFDKYSLDSD